MATDIAVNGTDIYITGYKTNVKNDFGKENDYDCYWKNKQKNRLDINFIYAGLE